MLYSNTLLASSSSSSSSTWATSDEGLSPDTSPILNRFEALPKEILVEIATILDPIDRACLAFTCKHACSVLGRALKLNYWHDRWYFLYRLETQGTCPGEILCRSCHKFHLPRKHRGYSSTDASRACVNSNAKRAQCDSPHLPRQVYFDILAAMARSFLRNRPSMYNIDLLSSKCLLADGAAQIRSRTYARYRKRSFLLKTETILYAGPRATAGAFPNVTRIGYLAAQCPDIYNICQHASWAELWPFIFQRYHPGITIRNQWCSNGPKNMLPWINHIFDEDIHECLWTHERTCWTHCDASVRLDPRLRGIWGCGMCSTDYKVSTAYISHEGARDTKIVILTTWKNLGTGWDNQESTWREHMDGGSYDGGLDGLLGRSTPLYSAARDFEGMEDKSSFAYEPTIPTGLFN